MGRCRCRELVDAVVGLLRQNDARLGSLHRRLPGGNYLRAGACIDVRALRLGDNLGGQRLLVLCERLRVVDPHQDRAGVDVLAADHRNLCDAAIDPCRKIEPCRVHFALHQQGFAAHEIPDRQGSNRCNHHADDDGGDARGRSPALFQLLWWLRCLRGFRSGLRSVHGICHLHLRTRSSLWQVVARPRFHDTLRILCAGNQGGQHTLSLGFQSRPGREPDDGSACRERQVGGIA